MIRLSDQELELVSAKGASQGLTEVASKVGEAEGASQDSAKDSAKDVSQDSTIGRKAKSKITNVRTGHFKNFFMC